tara:strand:+ start:23565 stop:24155 length:591 start_codon:yes stop_codon:yes gene_type:complete
MVLSYLKLSYESIVLPYDDEKTPLELAGKKMLPIMEMEGKVLNESLEIISLIDKENKLKTKESIAKYDEIEPLLNEMGSNIHSLAMPYFIWTPEFDQNSRQYFQKKKEVKRGPFKELVHNREKFETALMHTLEENKDLFQKDFNHHALELNDILIAAHMWGMYIVPEFQYPEPIHRYLQKVKAHCDFEYHGDYWRL